MEREYMAEHLEPGHAYRLRVCCFSAGGQSDVSYLCQSISDDVIFGAGTACKTVLTTMNNDELRIQSSNDICNSNCITS